MADSSAAVSAVATGVASLSEGAVDPSPLAGCFMISHENRTIKNSGTDVRSFSIPTISASLNPIPCGDYRTGIIYWKDPLSITGAGGPVWLK